MLFPCCSLTWWGCFQPCSYGPTLPVTSSSGIFSLFLLSWTFLFWGQSSWTPGSLPLLERACKYFSLHCSQLPVLPSSCADVKNFRLNRSAARTVMGALSQLNPSHCFHRPLAGPVFPRSITMFLNLSLTLYPFPVRSLFMLPLTLAMGMCFGHLYCMLLLAEARYFSFCPLFIPTWRPFCRNL